MTKNVQQNSGGRSKRRILINCFGLYLVAVFTTAFFFSVSNKPIPAQDTGFLAEFKSGVAHFFNVANELRVYFLVITLMSAILFFCIQYFIKKKDIWLSLLLPVINYFLCTLFFASYNSITFVLSPGSPKASVFTMGICYCIGTLILFIIAYRKT